MDILPQDAKQIFLLRKPIFDINCNIAAYELVLDYQGEENPPKLYNNISQELPHNLFLSANTEKLFGKNRIFVRLNAELLMLPIDLPKESVVIELDQNALDEKRLTQTVKQLAKNDYAIAIKNFNYKIQKTELFEHVSIIKGNFLQLDET